MKRKRDDDNNNELDKRRKIRSIPAELSRYLQQDRDFLRPRRLYPLDVKQIEIESKRTEPDPNADDFYGMHKDFMKLIPFKVARDVFHGTIRRISFDEFLGLLDKAANEFHRKYYPRPYSMVIPGMNRCKSNFWVAELLFEYTVLNQYPPVSIYGDCSRVAADLVLFADDGLFTGEQMENSVSNCRLAVEAVVLVAVATSTGKRRVERSVHGPETTVIAGDKVDSLIETATRLGGKHLDAYAKLAGNSRAMYWLAKPIVYFDHKLPDWHSVSANISKYIVGCRGHEATPSWDPDDCLVPPYTTNPSCLSYDPSP